MKNIEGMETGQSFTKKGWCRMKNNGVNGVIDWSAVADEELAVRFDEVCRVNGTSPEEVLSAFIKDYVVSSGHPEKVISKWPWSKNTL